MERQLMLRSISIVAIQGSCACRVTASASACTGGTGCVNSAQTRRGSSGTTHVPICTRLPGRVTERSVRTICT